MQTMDDIPATTIRFDIRDDAARARAVNRLRDHAVRVVPGPRRRWADLTRRPHHGDGPAATGYATGYVLGRAVVGTPLAFALLIAGLVIEASLVIAGAVVTGAAALAAAPGALVGGVLGRGIGALTGNPHAARNGSVIGGVVTGGIVGIPLGVAWVAASVVGVLGLSLAGLAVKAVSHVAGVAVGTVGGAAGFGGGLVRHSEAGRHRAVGAADVATTEIGAATATAAPALVAPVVPGLVGGLSPVRAQWQVRSLTSRPSATPAAAARRPDLDRGL